MGRTAIKKFGYTADTTVAQDLFKSIVDPDNRIYGYLYSVATSTNIKVIDEYTLWIDDMTLRPEDKAEYTIY